MSNRFFVDAETHGLYGSFLSVAAMVTDEEGEELERFYGAIELGEVEVTDPWVREHVLPYLSQAERFFPTEGELLDAFWDFWMKHREAAECIADVAYPVEARLFRRCVEKRLPESNFLGPFPLYDLSTLLRAKGLPPLAERTSLVREKRVAHDAMNDVKMLAELWNRLIDK